MVYQGEVISVPLPQAITSIWSLPFGLLLERAPEGSLLTNISSSSSNPFLSGRDVFHQKRDIRYSPHHNYTPPYICAFSTRSEGTSMSSHLILKDPLDEPEITYMKGGGKLNLMWALDERTIWTSNCVPIMASYNKGKMQHSLWVVEVDTSNHEVANSKASDLIAPQISAKHLFRRIWQGKVSQAAASKVFLANDDDGTPIICFLFQEQQMLLSLQLQILELNNETVYDIKPDMSWSISAIAAAAVTVTRPKARVGQIPARDVIALTPENTLLLYGTHGKERLPGFSLEKSEMQKSLERSKCYVTLCVERKISVHILLLLIMITARMGKLCLCKYVMPSPLVKEQHSRRMKLSINNTAHDLKILDLVDAVEGRINLVLSNGQKYRCTLRRSPSSSLTNECITAMSEGLSSSLYSHFLGLLWGDDDSTYLAKANSHADSEWVSFCNVITKMCRRPNTTSQLLLDTVSCSSWEFLIRSKYDQRYLTSTFVAGAFPRLSSGLQGLDLAGADVAGTKNTDESFFQRLLTETLDSLHAVYETLKLDNLRSSRLRFAGTRDGNAQELLYKYAVYFLNEIKHTCLHLIVLSLCVVMAGSGHLQTFRFLKFLRNRNFIDGHASFGTQTAVSLAIGFLFLGGGMWTFSTSNSSIAALLITVYPRLPTGPNDNRCHLQAFRHLYVLATEGRWIQTVDVDTGLPVYVPLEVTIKETELYNETSFCDITPCNLPERAILKGVRVCGPRYWPQVIELCPKQEAWWNARDKNHPFNSGLLYVKRKIGACSYADDPIGSQSLLSRTMHKMCSLTQPKSRTSSAECEFTVDQFVSTFSSDPSLLAFAQLFCDSYPGSRSELDFQEFCLQVLFECVSKDRPAMLQVYLSLYTTIGHMVDSVVSGTCVPVDSLALSSLKIAVAYNDAISSGRLTTSRGEIVQQAFLGSLKKRVEDLLKCCPHLSSIVCNYTKSGEWLTDNSSIRKNQIILSWYLQWYAVPSPSDIQKAVKKMKCTNIRSSIPLLRLVFPTTHIDAIDAINKLCLSSKGEL
ncbi:hypothetical protein OROGR_025691 [Orobanche gracilis]